MEHSRTGVKNILLGTFSITREQQSYQGLISLWQKNTETTVKRVSQAKEEMSIKNNSSSQNWWKHTEHIQIHEYHNTQNVAGQKQKQKGVKPT